MTEKTRFRVEREDGDVIECYLDDEPLASEEENTFFVESHKLKDFRLSEIPNDVLLVPIKGIESDLIYIDLPAQISRYEDGRAAVRMDFTARRKYWDEEVGLGKYVAALRKALDMRAASIRDIEAITLDDDGDYIFLYWDLILTEDLEAQDALSRIGEAYDEVTGHTEQILYGFRPSPKDVKDEATYTKRVIIPLLISMGFQDVHYSHGQTEFGKDVTFSRLDEFSILRHYGAQIKFGNISGKANSHIDELIGQIEDAFAMPYVSLYGKDKRYISVLYIIASGKFTSNAQDKIINKVSQPAVRSNVFFLDGEKVMELVERFAHRAVS